jgi:DNA-binding response OmpR family regulator
MKILAVDDDQFALDILSSSLLDAGHNNFVTALSGSRALEAINAAEIPFDILLLDIDMPGMNGIELCEKIKTLSEYKAAPIIMITAMEDRHFIDGAFAAGAMDYVSKPFDPIELGVRISLATRVLTQSRQIESSKSEVEYLKMRSGISTNLDSSEAMDINEIPRVVGMTAMENYLLRLTSGMARQSQSMAFSIDGFDMLHANMSYVEIYDILADTADAIATGLKRVKHLITYCGSGVFVAVCHKSSIMQDSSLLPEIQNTIDSFGLCFVKGRPFTLKLQQSKSYTPNVWAAFSGLNLLNEPIKSLPKEQLAPLSGKKSSQFRLHEDSI